MNPEDRELMRSFLSEVHEVISSGFTSGLVPYELRERFNEAWSEMNSIVETELDNPELEAALSRGGLSGASLRFEVDVFRRAVSDFHNSRPRTKGIVQRLIRPFARERRERPRRFFSRALNLANNVLGSLAGIVPGAEGLKQIKGGVEGLTKR